MPFVSKSQHKWMRANKPKMAERWSQHTKDIKSLPEHVAEGEKDANDFMSGLSAAPNLTPQQMLTLSAIGGLGGAAYGAGTGAALGAPIGGLVGLGRGDVPEGIGRGVLRGASAGAGVGLGGGLGAAAGGALGGTGGAWLGSLGGAGLGGLAAYLASGKLLGKPKSEREEKRSSDVNSVITKLAHQASEVCHVEKLAQDAEMTTEMVHHLAGLANLPASQFVKAAYADPDGFIVFLKLASGAITPSDPLVKQAMGPMGAAGGVIQGLSNAAGAVSRVPGRIGGAYNQAMGGGLIDKLLRKLLGSGGQTMTRQGVPGAMPATPGLLNLPGAVTNTATRRAATGLGLGGTALGTAGTGTALAMRGGSPVTPASPAAQGAASPGGSAASAGGSTGGSGGGALPSSVTSSGADSPDIPGGGEAAGGMSPSAKALLAGGVGAGAGALGTAAVMRRKKREKTSSHLEMFQAAAGRAIFTKAAETHRKEATDLLCRHLDAAARHMPLEKTGSVRTIQRELAGGKPLVDAIKVAYPHLNGAQHGIVASRMVRSALAWNQR